MYPTSTPAHHSALAEPVEASLIGARQWHHTQRAVDASFGRLRMRDLRGRCSEVRHSELKVGTQVTP